MKKYVSIDIGGTAIKYGIICADGGILVHKEMPTEAHKGGASILEKAAQITRQLLKEHTISGICISTAGIVDKRSHFIRSAFNPWIYRRLPERISGKTVPDSLRGGKRRQLRRAFRISVWCGLRL